MPEEMIGNELFTLKVEVEVVFVALGLIAAIAAAVLSTVKYNATTRIVPINDNTVIMTFKVRHVRSLLVRDDTQHAPTHQQMGRQNPTKNRARPVEEDFGLGACCCTMIAG